MEKRNVIKYIYTGNDHTMKFEFDQQLLITEWAGSLMHTYPYELVPTMVRAGLGERKTVEFQPVPKPQKFDPGAQDYFKTETEHDEFGEHKVAAQERWGRARGINEVALVNMIWRLGGLVNLRTDMYGIGIKRAPAFPFNRLFREQVIDCIKKILYPGEEVTVVCANPEKFTNAGELMVAELGLGEIDITAMRAQATARRRQIDEQGVILAEAEQTRLDRADYDRNVSIARTALERMRIEMRAAVHRGEPIYIVHVMRPMNGLKDCVDGNWIVPEPTYVCDRLIMDALKHCEPQISLLWFKSTSISAGDTQYWCITIPLIRDGLDTNKLIVRKRGDWYTVLR